MSNSVRRLIATALLAVTSLLAPQGRGAISGIVTDAQGAAVPGATVEVRNSGTNSVFRTTTNEAGFYTAPGLAVGSYEIAVEASGFKRTLRTGVVLEVDQKASIDLAMEVGQVSECVEAAAEAPLVDAN